MNKVYWITGLSGSGKTTIGRALQAELQRENQTVIFLDGDEMRPLLCPDLGYTEEDRRICALRYAGLCKLLHDQNFTVICCTISMFHQVRDWNRENIDRYFEIYIKVNENTLEQRDQKGMYSQKTQNMTGKDILAEFPRNPDCTVVNDHGNIEEIINQILHVEEDTK
ncbi:MAG: adenylyl-sulfate kinase [Eubacteriales bacterium]